MHERHSAAASTAGAVCVCAACMRAAAAAHVRLCAAARAGIIALELLQKWDVHMDWVSFTYILYNFAMVGSVTLFFFPAPLLMKQCYLILTGKPCGGAPGGPNPGTCS